VALSSSFSLVQAARPARTTDCPWADIQRLALALPQGSAAFAPPTLGGHTASASFCRPPKPGLPAPTGRIGFPSCVFPPGSLRGT
jgi:hypothetical protein